MGDMSNDDADAEALREERGADPSHGTRRPFVVGLGASAGGLGALEAFLSETPSDSGMAFIVITHQHPDQPSLLPELLGRRTDMEVELVTEATPVQPNRVYLPMPGHDLAILGGVLQPMDSESRPGIHMPIDYFFRSLARDQGDRAIGIVLSGTGTDGSLGLREIKAALGMVMVQDEQSAQYSGMPHSAIATALVDYVLPAAELPAQLLAYAASSSADQAGARGRSTERALGQILVLLRDQVGHDFSGYKPSTIIRRVERRMSVHHIDTMTGYLNHLGDHPDEGELLFRELLIGVTSFFRDPEAWAILAEALTDLLADKPEGYVLRAWVPGCSTGEEAYSLAILLQELLDELDRELHVQIFATDLDDSAVATARDGAFPRGVASDLSPERLTRFFTQIDDTYRVRNEIREMVVFAAQNVIADPPFTKLDLIICRNLLIYLDGPLQRRLLPIFHYALNEGGLMFLGASESLGPQADLFSTLDKKWKVFRRVEVVPGSYVAEFPAARIDRSASGVSSRVTALPAMSTNRLEQAADRMILSVLAPPTVLVRERGDVVYVHGRTGMFLEPARGPQTTPNIFNMAREGLQLGLSAAIRQAATSDEEVIERGLRVRTNGDVVVLDLRARRLQAPEALCGLIRITFELQPSLGDEVEDDVFDEAAGGGVLALQRELQQSQQRHQATFEELETANEELKSANEELQSTNEELQSANEELETSKEEMQSLNEELQTVNAELQGKLDELSRANNDMKNLLNGTDIGTVFLDTDLRIQRFTEQAKRVIRLIPSDVGRSIGDLASTLRYGRLVEDAREVLRTLVVKETEVHAHDGAVYLMRILPYRTTENVIDGLVLTFIDLTDYKAVQSEQLRLVEALQSSPVRIFRQDAELRITWASGSTFGRGIAALVGRSDDDLFEASDAARISEAKRRVLNGGSPEFEQVALVVDGAQRTYELFIEPARSSAGGLFCVVVDVTPRAEGSRS